MNEGNKSEPWVSIEDVAAHLGVRRDSIYRWIEHRGLPATKIGKLWKMKLSEVDLWMRQRAEGKGVAQSPAEVAIALTDPSATSTRPSTAATDASSTKPMASASPLVLVLDDDPMVRDTLEDFFTDEGYRVLLAGDGEDALTLLSHAHEKPALIVLDLKMPRLDGWRFRERQCGDPTLAAIPVIAITAVQDPKLEGVMLLRKPLHLDQLAQAVRQILADKEHKTRTFATANNVLPSAGGRHV